MEDEKSSGRKVIPTGTIAVTVGADSQSDGFYYLICCWGRRMECWLPLTGRIVGDMRSSEPWDALTEILGTTWLDFSGNGYRSVCSAIDVQGTSYTNTLEFVRAVGGRLRLKAIRGYAPSHGLTAGRSSGILRNSYADKTTHAIVTNVDVNIAKTIIAEMLSRDEVGPGYVHLPMGPHEADCGGWDTEAVAELTSEYRKRTNIRGYTSVQWFKHHGRANHRLDCFAYGLAALHLSRIKINECDPVRTEARNVGEKESAPSTSPFGAKRMIGTRELAINDAEVGGIVPHWSKGGAFGKLPGSGVAF